MYGPIFDTISAVIEEVFQINDMKNIYIMRHCLNFIFLFYRLSRLLLLYKNIIPKNNYALLLSFFYLFHPRLLGQGFFNKDSKSNSLCFKINAKIRSFLYFKFKDLIFSEFLLVLLFYQSSFNLLTFPFLVFLCTP